MRRLLILSLVLLSANLAHASSTWRCDGKLVSVGDPSAVVQNKCGAPLSRDITGSKLWRDDYGFEQEVVIEEWVYGPRNGMYHFLTFEGGVLKKINSRRQQ